MKLLVTGGAGFIGSQMLQYYRKLEEDVTVVDKLTYAGDASRIPEEFQLYRWDIADLNWQFLLEKTAPQVIINMAAESHVDNSIAGEGSTDFIQSNIVGVHKLVDGIRKYRMKTGKEILLIHVSTDEVCGDFAVDAMTSGYMPYDRLIPNNPYSGTKAAAELLIQAAHHTYRDFDYLIVRATNNYGPNQHFEKFLPTVISNALQDKPIPVYGKGDNIREWLYSWDFVRGIDMLMRTYRNGRVPIVDRIDRIFHFGSHDSWSNIEVVRMILKKLGKPESLISFVDDRPGHDRMYRLNWSKTEKVVGWTPEVPFTTTGWDIVIEDIKQRIGA